MEREQEEAETRVDSTHLGGPEHLDLTRVQERERERERECVSGREGLGASMPLPEACP